MTKQHSDGNEGLNMLDKVEWSDVARKLKPDLTEAEYESMWTEFVALKKQKELQ
jgi:hypothetical protein